MRKIIMYARDGPEMLALTDFAISRNYTPDQVAMGTLPSVTEILVKGDTLVLHTIESFDSSHMFGFSVPVMKLLDKGVTVVTLHENLVLKDDTNSMIAVGFRAMAQAIQNETKQNLAITSPDTTPTDES